MLDTNCAVDMNESAGDTAAAAVWGIESTVTSLATDTTSPVELFFEDNFSQQQQAPVSTRQFKRLDDSAQYLAILEAKLHKIKTDPRVLERLAARREQCMRELCEPGNGPGLLTDSQLSLDRSVGLFDDESKANDLVRRICPEQPLSAGEVVSIVKHDVLQIRHDEDELLEEELKGVSVSVKGTDENQDNVSR